MKSAEVWKSWRDRFLRYQEADLTVAEFCDWEGISPAAFYMWRKKLRAGSELYPHRPVSALQTGSASVLGFVQILPGVSPAQGASEKVVMTLVDGTRVEFPTTDRELIAHVLSVATMHSTATLDGGSR
jgi:hypothetical protein